MNRYILLALLAGASALAADAAFPFWQVAPQYENLTRWKKDAYVFERNGKYGVIRNDNVVVLPAELDFITPFANGYALAGVKNGQRYQLMYIISEDGIITRINDTYFLGPIKYVSEGKLPVVDRSGKYGYINARGERVIKCQFADAGAFKQSLAPVKIGNYYKIISAGYDSDPSRSVLRVDFKDGDLTFASSFGEEGAVVAYNSDYALINRSGKTIRKLKAPEFDSYRKRYNAAPESRQEYFAENKNAKTLKSDKYGKYSLFLDGELAVYYDLDAVGKVYTDGDILANVGGKWGILGMNNSSISANASSSANGSSRLTWRNGAPEQVSYVWTGPFDSLDNPQFVVAYGDRGPKDVTSDVSISGNRATYTFVPEVAKGTKDFKMLSYIDNDGLTVFYDNDGDVLTVSYPVELHVGAPGPGRVRANSSNLCTVSATIRNDSEEAVNVNYSWSTGTSGSVTIPANSSRSVSTSISCTSSFSRSIKITANGKSASSTITFDPYF